MSMQLQTTRLDWQPWRSPPPYSCTLLYRPLAETQANPMAAMGVWVSGVVIPE